MVKEVNRWLEELSPVKVTSDLLISQMSPERTPGAVTGHPLEKSPPAASVHMVFSCFLG